MINIIHRKLKLLVCIKLNLKLKEMLITFIGTKERKLKERTKHSNEIKSIKLLSPFPKYKHNKIKARFLKCFCQTVRQQNANKNCCNISKQSILTKEVLQSDGNDYFLKNVM